MTATLPSDVQSVFDRFVTTELTTVDPRGQVITWPVTPYYSPGAPCIDLTTGIGYPKKADDARANPHVALLFSDPTGSGLERPPAVLIQGTAVVDDEDLDANRERYLRESAEKLPATRSMHPPAFVRRFLFGYYARIYVHVRPERVYVWPGGDFSRQPELYDSHMEEVRTAHSQEPEVALAEPTAGATPWDHRLRELGSRYETAVLSLLAPDGFPVSARVPIELDEAAGKIRILEEPAGMPLTAGRGCLTAHEHEPSFKWQVNFQVRGNVLPDGDAWMLVPRKLVGGFELPPGSALQRNRMFLSKTLRMYRKARRETRKRAG